MFQENLQHRRISLLENGELAIVPGDVQNGDIICILSGAVLPSLLRPGLDGSWTLISGDCYIFTDKFVKFPEEVTFFMCDEYILCNLDRVEEFRLR